MSGTTYGYARVSAKDQNLDRQLIALEEFPIEKELIYTDKASGKDFNRPAYRRLMRKLKPGDEMVITSIDRLGRNYREILDEWRCITRDKGASIVVLDMPLLDMQGSENNLTGVFIADVVLQLLSYIAQIERDNIRQRQAEGIAAAKAKGVKFGRPPKERPGDYQAVKRDFEAGVISRREAARKLEVSAATFGKWIKEDNVA